MTPNDAPLFPDAAAPRRGRRLVALAVAVVVAVLAVAVGTSVASSGDTAQLVTAVAGVHDVAAELHGVATIEPVVQAAVSFPADGRVSSLDVGVGDQVAVGQQLAALDLDDLTTDLHAAEAQLAQAELDLRKALDGESVDESPSGGTSAAPASTTTATTAVAVLAVATATDSPGTAAADDQLAVLQQAVLDAQQAVDAALAASEAALAAANEVCAASGGVDTAADAAETTTTEAGVDGGADVDACRTALDEVLVAQQATAAAQRQLAVTSAALDEYLLSQNSTNAGGSGGTASSGGSSPTPGGSSAGSTSSASSSPSSAQLIALQQQVDAAALGVAVAQQAIAQASIVSPIAGTVVAVGFDVGDDVTAASSTQTVIVQGDDGMEAVTTVALSDVASVRVGQIAAVIPDGSDEALAGEVVAVAAVPDDDATTTSYRVTIGFADGDDTLGNGTTGSVTIVTNEVSSALAVPTSAITWQDGRALVQVVTDGVASAATIEVGVIGSEWTAVTAGLEEGDVVVLADPAEALPGSATEASQSSSGATSPFGADGGQIPSGGFPSGGFGGRPGGN